MAWDTAANIINDAAAELALQTSDVAAASMYASTDVHIIQLVRLLKGLGQDLLRDHQWSHLVKTHTFSTSDTVAAYDPPTDYARTIDQTHWNRDSDMPLLGPIGGPAWQYLKAVSSTGTSQLFRVFNDQLNIHPTPSSTQTVAFEYVSRYWVRRNWQASTAYVVGDVVINDTAKVYTADTAGTSAASGGPTGTSTNIADGTARWDYTAAMAGANGTIEYPTWGGDTLLFDRRLLVAGLKYRYLTNKGMPSDAALNEFRDALDAAKGGDGAAPVLSLVGRGGVHYLDGHNIPDSGVGS